MYRLIGFSTDAVKNHDIKSAITMLPTYGVHAVEVSLKHLKTVSEVDDVMKLVKPLLFPHIALYAPMVDDPQLQMEIADYFRTSVSERYLIVSHPQSVGLATDAWSRLGERLCVENVGRGSMFGRTKNDLGVIFAHLPRASLCFNIGHAKWIDTTMIEARLILHYHGSRMRQIHMSEVSCEGIHCPISLTAFNSFRKMSDLVPDHTSIILETPTTEEDIPRRMATAARVFQIEREIANGDA